MSAIAATAGAPGTAASGRATVPFATAAPARELSLGCPGRDAGSDLAIAIVAPDICSFPFGRLKPGHPDRGCGALL